MAALPYPNPWRTAAPTLTLSDRFRVWEPGSAAHAALPDPMATRLLQAFDRLRRREPPLEAGPAELVLSFAPGPAGAFVVHARSRGDEDGAQGLFRLPWDERELAHVRDRLQGCGRHTAPFEPGGVPTAVALDARRVGRDLFEALVSDPEVRRLYDRTRASAPDGRFRLRLVLDPGKAGMPTLHALPWELLSGGGGELLAVEPGVTVVRTLRVPEAVEPFAHRRPIRVLALLSGARDLDLERERRELETVAREVGGVEVSVEPATDLSGLEALLVAGRHGRDFHVLHLAGHAGIADGPRGGVLLWEPTGGPRREVAGRDLSTLLRRFPELRLVVLNACATAELPGEGADPFAGVAAALLQGGVPVVAAVQGKIRDEAALTFTRSFYGTLAADHTPEEATAAARWELWKADPEGFEWVKPVLFQGATPRRLTPWVLRSAVGLFVALVVLAGLAFVQRGWLSTRTVERRIEEAKALLLDDRPAEAARVLDTALDRPSWPPVPPEVLAAAHATAALAAEDLGNLDAAVEHAGAAAHLQPDRAIHHYNLGALLARAGHPGDAAVPLRRALELDPGLADAENELGCVYLDLGRPEDAREVLEAGVDAHPDHALLKKNLGRALLALGRPHEATRLLEQALTLLPAADWPARAEASFWLASSDARQADDDGVCSALLIFQAADPQGVTEHAPAAVELGRLSGCLAQPSPVAALGDDHVP